MKQRIERQIDNIKREYPGAVIITEKYTGTTTDRPKWNKLVEQIKIGNRRRLYIIRRRIKLFENE